MILLNLHQIYQRQTGYDTTLQLVSTFLYIFYMLIVVSCRSWLVVQGEWTHQPWSWLGSSTGFLDTPTIDNVIFYMIWMWGIIFFKPPKKIGWIFLPHCVSYINLNLILVIRNLTVFFVGLYCRSKPIYYFVLWWAWTV